MRDAIGKAPASNAPLPRHDPIAPARAAMREPDRTTGDTFGPLDNLPPFMGEVSREPWVPMTVHDNARRLQARLAEGGGGVEIAIDWGRPAGDRTTITWDCWNCDTRNLRPLGQQTNCTHCGEPSGLEA